MKILTIVNNFTITHIVDRLAQATEPVLFDIIMAPSGYQPIGNTRSIPMSIHWNDGAGYPPMKDIIKYAKDHENDYDFMFSFSNYWQNSQDVPKIKTLMLCPDGQCARLEGDKLFTKELLQSIGVPTPQATILDRNSIFDRLDAMPLPIVLKLRHGDYRLLSFGTNVFIDRDYRTTVEKLLQYVGNKDIYTETFIKGREMSMHFLCNGSDWIYLGEARDYKKLCDGDVGINTDGIGCYSPVDYPAGVKEAVFGYMNKIMRKLNSTGIRYKGIMYLGVIIDECGRPQILEINTRPGFPEMSAIVNRLDCRLLLENFISAAKGEPMTQMNQSGKATVIVLIHHKNYGLEVKTAPVFPILSAAPDGIKIIAAEPDLTKGNIWGALLAEGNSKEEASERIYSWLETQYLGDYTVRRDIGYLA